MDEWKRKQATRHGVKSFISSFLYNISVQHGRFSKSESDRSQTKDKHNTRSLSKNSMSGVNHATVQLQFPSFIDTRGIENNNNLLRF